jgi:hypothetical protein
MAEEVMRQLEGKFTNDRYRQLLASAYYLGWRHTLRDYDNITNERPAMAAVLTTLASTEPMPREGVPPLPPILSPRSIARLNDEYRRERGRHI